ncbi:MAG TPA: hypothetical protein VGM90_31025 [Kofleriaceae bacterium]
MGIRLTAAFFVAAAFTFAACKDDPLPASQPMIDAPVSDIDAPAGGTCGASTIDFLGVCTDNSQCGSCECHMIIHDSKCDKPCSSDADCPSPSRGCEGQGAGMGFYCRD